MTMVAAAGVGTGPRYAPHDPTLPHPWRALVDGNTGYLYYWNPESNVTQYEKPLPQPSSQPQAPPPLPPGPPPAVTPTIATATATATATAAGPMHHHHQVGSSDLNTNGMLIPPQHKLAAVPILRNQDQGMGLRHASHIPVGVANGSTVTSAPGPAQINSSYKYVASGPNYGVPPLKPSPGMHISNQPPSSTAVDAYRMEHEVTAMGDNVPAPFMTFDQAGLPTEILRELQNAGFTSPTPIQAQSWPVALQNRDIVAIAKTGSGKTLGYLMPAFIHLRRHHNNSQMGPTVLVLAPTRELATQIQDEAVKFGRSSRISCTCLYGGAPKPPQLRELERGADIVVATPGRLNDILEMKRVSLRQVSFLILDEADRMLDMGFEPQIRKIVNEIPRQRQTLMYTATWPKEVRKIAGDLLMNPVQVNIGDVNELSANKSITQYVEVVLPMEKQRRLEQILRGQEPGSKIIIFCSTKRMCDQLSRGLGRFGAAAIHGDKSQGERDWVLAQFRTGKSPVLVATDVAARGLDIKDIRVVINYDFPTGVEDYVHRIGRTGRAGATGLAYTFFSEQDGKYAPDLIKVLEGANQKVPPELRDIAARGGSFIKGRGGRWDFGARGGRDVGRGFGGGRGEPYNGGRGGDSYGGRGGWGASGGRFDRNDRGGYGGRGRYERDIRDKYNSGRDSHETDYLDRDRVRHEKYLGDKERSRDGSRRAGDRDRGRSYSRSYSRSPSRGRGRNYSRSMSRSRSHSRSRSRSRSLDRYKDRFNTYRGGPPENIIGNSPWRSGSPTSKRNGSPERPFSPRRDRSPHMLPLNNRDVTPTGTRSPYHGSPLNEQDSTL